MQTWSYIGKTNSVIFDSNMTEKYLNKKKVFSVEDNLKRRAPEKSVVPTCID